MKKDIDLKIPGTWETRSPVFIEKLLYVPDYYDKHSSFSDDSYTNFLMAKDTLIVEYCSGNGQWILEKAQNNPNQNFIAVEKKFARARKIWKKIHNYQLENLIVVLGSGEDFSNWYLPKNSINQVYINFPDPWPKEKHAKNRIIKRPFLDQVKSLLKPKGNICISSDHKGYIDQAITLFLEDSSWKSPFNSPYFVTELENYGTSFFDTLFRQRDLNIYYLQFDKHNV